MFDLVLPLIIATALGIDPPAPDPEIATVDTDGDGVAEQLATVDSLETITPLTEGSGDDLDATRPPEPQVPSGRFTTAVEVRPILDATKGNWVGVREFEGNDLVYFTHLMSWRCGLWDIRYGFNGAPATNVMPMEPCHDDLAQPNAMIEAENFLPFVIEPLGSVESVTVEIVYDDGVTDTVEVERDEVRIP